ncbi:MAG TPA: glycosyltransferase family 39 protein [Methylomirabilota bacterium]|nr:glycosyltransferase family 39 protein [Methylomirabilota bacterium]
MRPSPIAGAILVGLLGLALYLPGLGAEIIRHPLEAKYALVAREMLEGGPRLVPHVYGELFADKPPLYFWATAALGWLRGGRIDEVTARLPAVAAAVATLLLVHRLGTDLFGGGAGLLAGVVLATSNLFFWYARQGHLDQFLTAFVTLACLGLWRALTATTPAQAAAWTAVAYGAMGLGVLSKGLIGLVVPLLAGATYCLATGRIRAVPARLRLAAGLGVFLVIVLAWFVPAVARYGPGYFYETVVHQHVVRYTRTWAHAGPWYYYFAEFPVGFFPWVLFLPSAMILGWRAREATPTGRPFLFPLAWFVSAFVFFSLATGKRGPYLLPLYPAAALLVGWLGQRMLTGLTRSRWVGVPIALMSGAAALLAVGLLVVPRRLIPGRMVHTLVPADPGQLAAAVALLLAGAATVWLLWRTGHAPAAFAALVAVQAVLLLVVAAVRATQYEREFPVRAFAVRARAAVPAGQPVFSLFEDYNNIVAFYLGRPLRPLTSSAELPPADVAPVFALVELRDQPSLDGRPVAVMAEATLERRRLALVRLDPPRR